MSSWEIVATLKSTATVADLSALVGRAPDDTRRGAMWLAKDVGDANRIFIKLAESRLCVNVERYKRKVTHAARGLMVLALLVLALPALAAECPADRPHRIELSPMTMTCTAALCMGELKCDDVTGNGKRHCWRDKSRCPSQCIPSAEVFCISDDELEKARK